MPYLPAFLQRIRPINTLFETGCLMTFFSIVVYYFDIYKTNPNHTTVRKWFLFAGQYSLSYFFYIAFFNLLPAVRLWYMLPIYFGAMALLTIIFKQLVTKFHGIAVLDWAITILSFPDIRKYWKKQDQEQKALCLEDI